MALSASYGYRSHNMSGKKKQHGSALSLPHSLNRWQRASLCTSSVTTYREERKSTYRKTNKETGVLFDWSFIRENNFNLELLRQRAKIETKPIDILTDGNSTSGHKLYVDLRSYDLRLYASSEAPPRSGKFPRLAIGWALWQTVGHGEREAACLRLRRDLTASA